MHVVLDRIDDRIASTLSRITRHLAVLAADLVRNVTRVWTGVRVPQAVIEGRITRQRRCSHLDRHNHLAGESDRHLSATDNIVARLT